MLIQKLLPLAAVFATVMAVDPLLPAKPQSFVGSVLRVGQGYNLEQIDLKEPEGAQLPPPYGIYETSSTNLRKFLFKVPALRYLDPTNRDNDEERKESEILPEPKIPLDVDGTAEDSIAIVDLRPNEDFYDEEGGHIVGALRFPLDDDKKEQEYYIAAFNKNPEAVPNIFRSEKLNKAKYVLFYCNQGANRSPAFAKMYYTWRLHVFRNLNGQQTDLRADQEVVLLGGGMDDFKKNQENWPLIVPRPYVSTIKPVPVDNMIIHGSKLLGMKKEKSKGEPFADELMEQRNSEGLPGHRGDDSVSLLDTSRSDRAKPVISLDDIITTTPREQIKDTEHESTIKPADDDNMLPGDGPTGKKITMHFRA